MMKMAKPDRKSIKIRLVTAFVVTSIIPILLINIVYYYNTSRLVQQNVESMTKANLEQTRVSLDLWLESYEDILFQVYTDDTIVELVDRINAGEDVANNRKMLRKTLRGLFYTKDYVKSISIITESGMNFLADERGNLVACSNSGELGKNVVLADAGEEQNRMAIDREEYEISNMIGTLAPILRAGERSRKSICRGERPGWSTMEIFLYGRESPRGRLEAVFGDKMATAKTQTVQT